MSRLIIKNLPAYITPVRLKDHFNQKDGPGGTITDLKVALKQDGTSRRFGFVGYKTEAEAVKAKEWYDKTYIDSTRVRVEVIDGAKDAPTPRPNKRRRVDTSTADVHLDPSSSKAREPLSHDASDKRKESQLEQFMDVMQPRTRKGPSWAEQPPAQQPVKKSKKGKEVAVVDEANDNAQPEGLSDVEWMRRRMKQGVENAATEKAFEQSDDDELIVKPVVDEFKDPAKGTILHTARLFVRNLAFTCTEEELRELFQPFGELSQVHIPIDHLTKEPRGLAYVSFAEACDALTAYEALDKKSFQGRLLHIMGAVDRKGNTAVERGTEKAQTVRDQRDEKRKAVAGKEFNWGMLYMNSDAVLSSVADRMNVSKSDMLDPESSNAAVKLALAETHVIQETKAYLESQGVILSVFGSRGRSDTTILVKNIPYGTTAEQIRELFATHGELSRVLVPPAGTMAVVEFLHPDEAGIAFRAVAYRRLGNSVIYLEKGPLGMFQTTHDDKAITNDSALAHPITIDEPDEAADDEPPLSAGSTLFVKNLAFSTTAERLTQVFRHLPSFAFARVQTKPDPKRPGARLSMGYGFVGFKTAEAARTAVKGMQGHVLDGHALHVKFAGRGGEEEKESAAAKVSAKSRTTKMLVKNVPFEATQKEIRELFASHGQLKSVRLPKRFDRRTRGFAFLEFVTRHEAENAFNALRHTHFLGRHLVLEWAEEGDVDLEALRKKAGVGSRAGQELPGRKRKLMLDEDGNGEEDL
ncbi:RNA-binding domain-containing protein [Auriscalpium vulgare]|uniref:RNA-binding domain-containing protein n=1 Tax=Auriscalpium vulgare TaxID=40419 RepID=A0ACB8SC80_9AGAM|nr:RNA-binding domain-containing protein [Auriscalpium vulgare]